jgi:aconitate hydratase
MFFIDEQTIDYLRLTGREDEQVQLVETYARQPACGPTRGKASTSACCTSTCPAWCATWPARPTRTAPATSELAATHRRLVRSPGKMPDGAVIIAAITSCTNTSNPRNVIAAGLLARNANRLGLARKPGSRPRWRLAPRR